MTPADWLILGAVLFAVAWITLGVIGRMQRPRLLWRGRMNARAIVAAQAVALVRLAETHAERHALGGTPPNVIPGLVLPAPRELEGPETGSGRHRT